MVRCSELPEIAVEHILCRARGRCIAGTNRFARVCRRWRVASDGAEPLQLYVNLAHLSEEDLARASSWLSMHGQHVEVLVVQEPQYSCSQCGHCGPRWCVTAAPALHNLKRLDVAGMDTLLAVAPVLQQLPHLQHLAATVGLWCFDDDGIMLPGFDLPSGSVGEFTNQQQQKACGEVPDLQQLCPQLTSLQLTTQSHASGLRMDPRVSRLFSPHLQQLTLVSGPTWGFACTMGGPVLCAANLVHLKALQQLTLDGMNFDQQEMEEVAQGLPALQQLRVYQPLITLHGPFGMEMKIYTLSRSLVHLAPVLTEYEMCADPFLLGLLPSYVHLTRLELSEDELPEGAAAAVAALTGLRELGLTADIDSNAAKVVQQAAGMAHLRSLQLEGYAEEPDELCTYVAQCTQLTSLMLLVGGPDVSQWVAVLKQLPGLQCLTVCEQLVACEQGAWLASNTALTRLCVQLDACVAEAEAAGAGAEAAGVGAGAEAGAEAGAVVGAEAGAEAETGAEAEAGTSSSHGGEAVEQHGPAYHAKACSIWGQMEPAVAAGLQQVMFWASHEPPTPSFAPMCWQLDRSAPGGGPVSAWLEEQDGSAAGWARPLRPCPHLPGVWELQDRS